MFVLKIVTTVWLTLIAFGMVNTALNKKVTVSTRLLGLHPHYWHVAQW